MSNLDKILEILDKENPSEEEIKFIDLQVKDDPEVSKLISLYKETKSAFSKNSHIDEGLMAEYILLQHNLSENRILSFLKRKIDGHLVNCRKCEDLYKELLDEFNSVDEYVTNTVTDHKPQVETKEEKISYFRKFSAVKYSFVTIASLVLIYFALFAISDLTTPFYKQTEFIESRESFATRGRTTELFQRGLDALERNNYDSAIENLEVDIKENPNSESIFYTHFILGFTYVSKAEKDILGLFRSFDREEVLLGIKHFEKSIELNKSGRFNNLNPDAHYFIGKAYLLIDEKDLAKEHLKIVINSRGSYYKKAEELIEKL